MDTIDRHRFPSLFRNRVYHIPFLHKRKGDIENILFANHARMRSSEISIQKITEIIRLSHRVKRFIVIVRFDGTTEPGALPEFLSIEIESGAE
ncbi:hypothetical protein SDC9_191509 [bioreactor metagenome]|uniref:Uncharacterized protein n=1 Tax=bioreactor metagenome TaxID=1076179 RepID=A0A645HY66_9ZZZZ